ncbi:MAG: TAXI family TRAP transporter solute-binding subunit [Clostridiales bacterium]|nr:TAXI family TRAP transporter solute-binding subunit [Clostridiales bacterium]
MKKRKFRIISLMLILALAFSTMLTGCGDGAGPAVTDPDWPEDWPTSITMSAGPMGGGWFNILIAISELLTREMPQVSWTVIEGGGLGNIRLLQEGRDAQIATCHVPVLGKAIDGELGMEGFEGIRFDNIGMGPTLNVAFVVAVTRYDSGIETWGDIRGRRFSPGLATSGQIPIIVDILNLYGLNWETFRAEGGALNFVNYTEQVALMQDRNLDVAVISGDMPNAGILEMQANFPVRVLPFEDNILQQIAVTYPYMVIRPLTPERSQVVTQTEDIDVITLTSTLSFSGVLPDDFVAEVTRIIMEHGDQLREQLPVLVNLDSNDWDKALGEAGVEERWMHPGVRAALNAR